MDLGPGRFSLHEFLHQPHLASGVVSRLHAGPGGPRNPHVAFQGGDLEEVRQAEHPMEFMDEQVRARKLKLHASRDRIQSGPTRCVRESHPRGLLLRDAESQLEVLRVPANGLNRKTVDLAGKKLVHRGQVHAPTQGGLVLQGEFSRHQQTPVLHNSGMKLGPMDHRLRGLDPRQPGCLKLEFGATFGTVIIVGLQLLP